MDESPKRGLLTAYRRLLRPLVRILIRNGVSFSEFSEVAKETYVDVAKRDFPVSNQGISQKRIAALTGILGNEVQIVEDRLAASSSMTANTLDEIVRILSAWHTDSEFTGPYGIPRELSFEEEGEPDFTLLMSRHSKGSDPRFVLKKLLENGLIKETKKGVFKVEARNYRPEGNAPDGLEHLARTFQDIVNVLDHNRLEDDPKKRLFERQVYTENGISESDLPIFQDYVSTKANILLEEIDNWLSHLDKPTNSKGKRIDTGLGLYNYVVRMDETPGQPDKQN